MDESQHVNVLPHLCAHFQKGEIEKQVDDMLKQGIIWPSSSPFSSPAPVRGPPSQVGYYHSNQSPQLIEQQIIAHMQHTMQTIPQMPLQTFITGIYYSIDASFMQKLLRLVDAT